MRQRPKNAYLMMTGDVRKHCHMLDEAGCQVKTDHESGTVEAKDGDDCVFRAIQKGRNQPWIAMFYETDRIKWGDPKPPS